MNNLRTIVKIMINEMNQYAVIDRDMANIGDAIDTYEDKIEQLVFNHPSMDIYMKDEIKGKIQSVKTALGELQNVIDELTDDHFIDHEGTESYY